MSDRILHVLLDGDFMGTLHMSNSGAMSFTYDTAYLSAQNPTPLSLSMPVSQQTYGNRVVRPFLEGLLPDNPLALDAMAAKYQVSANSPFALLEHVGHDVAGALQIIRPDEESEDEAADRTAMEPVTDDELAKMLRNVIAMYSTGTPMRGSQRMSLAGAQAKLALTTTDEGQWAIPERGTPTTFIFKPQLAHAAMLPESDIVELFCQHVTAAAGLPCALSTLWRSPDGEIRAIVSKRYDRQLEENGTYRRLHQEDLCQAMSVPPSKKYQRQDDGPGIGQIARLFATRLSPSTAISVAKRFLAALTANAALLNTDAHAKNYALMLDGSEVSLAPMYDVLSIGAFLNEDTHPLFPMRLGTTFDLEQVFPETLVAQAGRLGLSVEDGEQIVHGTLGSLRASLDSTAESMSDLDERGIITRTVEAIHRHSSLIKSVS